MSPDARLRWLEQVAKELPQGSFINVSLSWQNDHGFAGIHLYEKEAAVFFNDAQYPIESRDEAVSILRRIFADEVVVVKAFANEQFVYCGLAPASDPSAGFGKLDGHSGSRDMPDIDYVTIENWSSGLQDRDEL